MRRALMAAAALGMLAAGRAEAGQIVGTQVTGSLGFNGTTTNFFDPGFRTVPGGYENTTGTTVTISSTAVEFGFNDGGNLDTADFTEGRLVFTDKVEQADATAPIQLTFSDTAFTGVTLDTSSFAGLTYSFSGDTISINIPGMGVTAGSTFTAAFDINPNTAATPEPATLGSLALAAIGSGVHGWRRSRRRKAA